MSLNQVVETVKRLIESAKTCLEECRDKQWGKAVADAAELCGRKCVFVVKAIGTATSGKGNMQCMITQKLTNLVFTEHDENYHGACADLFQAIAEMQRRLAEPQRVVNRKLAKQQPHTQSALPRSASLSSQRPPQQPERHPQHSQPQQRQNKQPREPEGEAQQNLHALHRMQDDISEIDSQVLAKILREIIGMAKEAQNAISAEEKQRATQIAVLSQEFALKLRSLNDIVKSQQRDAYSSTMHSLVDIYGRILAILAQKGESSRTPERVSQPQDGMTIFYQEGKVFTESFFAVQEEEEEEESAPPTDAAEACRQRLFGLRRELRLDSGEKPGSFLDSVKDITMALGKALKLYDSSREVPPEEFPFREFSSALEEFAVLVKEGLRTIPDSSEKHALLTATDEVVNGAAKFVECLGRGDAAPAVDQAVRGWKTQCGLFVKVLREHTS